MLALHSLLDDTKCYETVRQLRWPEGVCCPHCGSEAVSKQGFDGIINLSVAGQAGKLRGHD